MGEVYYSVRDIQSIMGCGRDKVYALSNFKTFPKTMIRKTIYIDKEEFNKWRKRNLYSEVILY